MRVVETLGQEKNRQPLSSHLGNIRSRGSRADTLENGEAPGLKRNIEVRWHRGGLCFLYSRPSQDAALARAVWLSCWSHFQIHHDIQHAVSLHLLPKAIADNMHGCIGQFNKADFTWMASFKLKHPDSQFKSQKPGGGGVRCGGDIQYHESSPLWVITL